MKKMPEISITLPSLRPEATLQRVKEFSATNGDSDYELVIVSPFAIEGDRVVHIQEKEPRGTAFANDIAYKNASADYIVWWADDVVPTENCLANIVNFVKSKNEPFIASFRMKDRFGKEKPQWTIYGKLLAGFGCASRNTIDLIGGYFDTAYRSYWQDPDMCLRAWTRGGKVEVCPNAWVIMEHIFDQLRDDNWDKYQVEDTKTFLNRWHDTFGKGIDRDSVQKDWAVISKPVYSPLTKLRLQLISLLARVPYLVKIKRSIWNKFA